MILIFEVSMIDDDVEREELDDEEEVDASVDEYNGPDSDEAEDINERDEEPVSKKVSKISSLDDEDLPNVEAKQKDRDALERAMEEFLSRGGKIQTLESEKD